MIPTDKTYDFNYYDKLEITIVNTKTFEMCQGTTDRAKATALLHLFYCVISAFILGIHMVILGINEETGFNWKILFFMYVSFCLVWFINDIIALLGVDDNKQHLLQCHVNFGATILIVGVPYFVTLLYFALFDEVYLDSRNIIPQIILPLLMFFGMILSSFSMIYCYQIKKESSMISTLTPTVQNEIECKVQNHNDNVKESEHEDTFVEHGLGWKMERWQSGSNEIQDKDERENVKSNVKECN